MRAVKGSLGHSPNREVWGIGILFSELKVCRCLMCALESIPSADLRDKGEGVSGEED
jgi:hypothetical protein